ncbi:oligopeptidase A [Candidatus Ishikawella capsulata]|uniref:oligopeptidase A n=1 Tax=Candidatus Ishikawaella capsulata Mpkobe TaxID=476281 RepID=C5WC50_9ENTR|nr:oligopeptidase A [Candidatus Ishikawaella capsulata]BAH82906.1 oligopeptidase A [Candidatus Ishikawaella capsulata Mpkobe]
MKNPLLTSFIIPPFSQIKPEHVVPAIHQVQKKCRSLIELILSQNTNFTWNNFCQPLLEANDRLNRVFSPISHLNAVKNTLKFREEYKKALILLTQYNTWVARHQKLYNAYKVFRDSEDYNILDLARKKLIDNILRDFELSGISLPREKQICNEKIMILLSELESNYNNNVLDSTRNWNKIVKNPSELTGIPENILKKLKIKAQENNKIGWLLTLDEDIYTSIITYCDNEALRKEIYKAYLTRASDEGPNAGKWDNSTIIVEQLLLRNQQSKLLGFSCFAEKSFATKMASNPKQVIRLFTKLVKAVRCKAKQEISQLKIFVKEKYGKKIFPWDLKYYSQKQKKHIYHINDEELRCYFPEDRVINGLFKLIKLIYGMTTRERYDIDIWHPTVRFFDVFDENGELRGSFYMDLYSRSNKMNGAWMDSCLDMMRRKDGTLQKPVAYLNCNIRSGINNIPALFNHNDIITIFHEFGHTLHHILTKVEIPGVSGINGVPWDAVELPSQLMENWCWEPEVLSLISGHYETGEKLPKPLLMKIIDSKNYQRAIFLLRQLEMSLFDLHLHTDFYPVDKIQILKLFEKIKKQVNVVPHVKWDRFPHSFRHIFAGGYAAGYYSYLWANILSADAFSRFKEDGIFNRNTGESFLKNILINGGVENPIRLFKRFRGRLPRIEFILDNYEIKLTPLSDENIFT